MSINKEKILNIINNDLTGYKIEIISHTDSNLMGIIGLILNETKTSLTIDFDGASGSETYDGAGSFISGDDNQFSVFLVITVTREGETAEVKVV